MRENVLEFMATSIKKNDLERFKDFYKNPTIEEYNYFKKMIKFAIESKKTVEQKLEKE